MDPEPDVSKNLSVKLSFIRVMFSKIIKDILVKEICVCVFFFSFLN